MADQAMRFPADNGADRQDPLIAPLGTLVDASEIALGERRPPRVLDATRSLHRGTGAARRHRSRQGRDRAESRAHESRVGAADEVHEHRAVCAALVRHRAGHRCAAAVRHEDGELEVDDYTTTFFRNRAFVEGGTLEYKEDMFNAGAIWRIVDDWSVFASYSEGFTLPNVGIPLRNINTPGRTVEGILDLQAIIFDNKEIGFNWRGERASLRRFVLRVRLGLRRFPARRPGDAGLRPRSARRWRSMVSRSPPSYRLTDQLRCQRRYTRTREGKTTGRPAERAAQHRDGRRQHQPRQVQPLGAVGLPAQRATPSWARPRCPGATSTQGQRRRKSTRTAIRCST